MRIRWEHNGDITGCMANYHMIWKSRWAAHLRLVGFSLSRDTSDMRHFLKPSCCFFSLLCVLYFQPDLHIVTSDKTRSPCPSWVAYLTPWKIARLFQMDEVPRVSRLQTQTTFAFVSRQQFQLLGHQNNGPWKPGSREVPWATRKKNGGFHGTKAAAMLGVCFLCELT